MRFLGKFRLFAVSSLATGGMFAALMLAFVLAGAVVSSPAAASTIPAAWSGTYEQTAMGEIGLRRTAEPRAPDRPAECFELDHSCEAGALPPSRAGALPLGVARRVSFVTPRAPERVPVPDVAPRLAASRSILFRNFRK